MFDFSIVTNWFDTLLRQTCGLSDFWAILIECVLVGVIVLTAYALICIVLIFMERKVCAYFQCRVGPMRVGPWGIFQVFADVVKMLIKEIFSVDRADKLLYYLAPILVMVASVGTFSFLPFNKGMEVLDFNVGVFMITAVSSLGVIGIFMAGWASNNKYSVVSAMRGAVQLISYEMSLGLCYITAVVFLGTMQMSGIVEAQTGPWNWLIIQGHVPACVAFLVFLIAGNAEANRGPFDLAEAESELTAGYHTEYGIRLLLPGRVSQPLCHRRTGSRSLPRRMGAAEHRHRGFRQPDEPHPGLHLVLRQDLFPCVYPDVDPLDVPAPAHRPDLEVGVEVPDAADAAHARRGGRLRGLRTDALRTKNKTPVIA